MCIGMTDTKQSKKTKLEIGKELLTPIVEILDYETALGKLFTKGVDLKDAVAIKLSVPVNLFAMNIEALAREQDRARQQLAYQQDIAAIKVLRQKPLLCKTFKEGIEQILETFNKRRLICSHILIPRTLIVDLVNDYSEKVAIMRQRELVMAGYVGLVKETLLITSASTFTFEIIDANEIVGVDSTKCKMEVVSDFKCVDINKDSQDVFFACTVKLKISDPEGVVWVELPKKE